MDASRMRPDEVADCRWLGYEIRKGVTHPGLGHTAMAGRGDGRPGLHGRLVQRFGGVDPMPRCYDRDAPLGFAGFVRWVRFEGSGHAVLGIDWSIDEPAHIGVATSALEVARVARSAIAFGITPDEELALLTPRMTEETVMRDWRRSQGLVTVGEWAEGVGRFSPGSEFCPSCGQWTFFDPAFQFCFLCGKDPHQTWRSHGVEK